MAKNYFINEPLIPQLGDFQWQTGRQIPRPKSGILVQYTRYLRGALITTAYEDIKEIIPYPKKKRGGNIIYKNGAKDQYYMVWPMRIVN